MTKFCPEVCEAIFDGIKKGHTYESACDYAGITYSAFYEWKKQGEQGYSEEKKKFLEDLKKAEATMIRRCLDVIGEAAEKNQWQAGAWLLERRKWKIYGKPAEQELNARIEKLEKGNSNNETSSDQD